MLREDAIRGHQTQSIDELMQHAAQNLASQAQAEQQARQQADEAVRQDAQARAQQSAKGRQAEAAQQRQDAAAQQAGQSVREIFRKLASALHPDCEPDPAERQRKTLLMQQANQAYDRNDLLTLLTVLTLQLDLEQIDSRHLASLTDDRLLHYNQVLQEQLAALQQEVADSASPYLAQMGSAAWGRKPVPATIDAALTLDMLALDDAEHGIRHDIVRLRDPATRRALIDQIEVADPDDEPDAFEAMLLMEAMADALKGAMAPNRPRRPKVPKGRRGRG